MEQDNPGRNTTRGAIHAVVRKIPVCDGRTRRASLHAGGYTKRGGEGGEHGDDDLNDFAPNGRFVVFHRFRLVSSEERVVHAGHIMNVETRLVGSNSCHAVRASRKVVNSSTLTVPRLQVQSYNTLHPTCHLLAFSIAKISENMRLTNRHSIT